METAAECQLVDLMKCTLQPTVDGKGSKLAHTGRVHDHGVIFQYNELPACGGVPTLSIFLSYHLGLKYVLF